VIAAAVRSYFTSAGVDLSTNSGKVVIFNDRKGTLTIRATAEDLDLIEAAIQTLNTSPPEINIKAKFVEITQNDNAALGFNWNLGNFNIGRGGAVVASGGTQPSLISSVIGGVTNYFPGVDNTFANTLTLPATTDTSLTQGLRNSFVGGANSANIPAIATVTGILTDPQFRATINALQQRDGTDVLTAPEVTTESGRQAQMQAVDIQQIVTSSGLTFGNTGGTATGTGTVVAGASTPAFSPGTTTLSFGPTLDVIAYVSADEFSVQMTLIPSVTDFIGYDNPGNFVPQASVPSGGTVTSVLPLPHFRLRQVVTSVTVWDAQTVVIGGLMTDSIANTKDEVPLLGDLPLVGRLFRSEASEKSKKNLMIFVTPTIINPDGTRYHSDDEMPFAQNGSITQRTANP
jgi:general secretion pathway protein D